MPLDLTKEELKRIYLILKALEEGQLGYPAEEWELDHFDERLIDRKGIRQILGKLRRSLPERNTRYRIILTRKNFCKVKNETRLLLTEEREAEAKGEHDLPGGQRRQDPNPNQRCQLDLGIRRAGCELEALGFPSAKQSSRTFRSNLRRTVDITVKYGQIHLIL